MSYVPIRCLQFIDVTFDNKSYSVFVIIKMELSSNVNHCYTNTEVEPSSKPPPHPPPDKKKYTLHADKDSYDFVAHRSTRKPTNTLESIGHLVKGCLGGGILGIHEAYMKCGLWSSLVITIVFGFYITYCVHILVKSAQILYKRLHVPEMSYPDVAEASLEIGPFPKLRKYSKWFRYAVDLIICIDLFGACCVYQIIIAKTIKQLIGGNEGIDSENLNYLRLYILALLVPILLLCMITTLKYLAPFTLLADVFIVACVIATVVYSLRSAPDISTVPAWKDVIGFFEFCGIVVFSMEGIGVSLPIENNMKEPKKFPIILSAGMTVVVSFLIVVGFFGYWGFGESSRSPVTLNFPSEIFATIMKCLMAVMIFVTFALNFWAPFNLVWHYVSKKHDPKKHWLWERLYRGSFIIVITAIAIAFPNIGNLMGLLGAFCLSNMGFIFPAIIELLVVWEDPGLGKYRWRLWKNVLVLLVGILLFIAGTYSNVKGLIANL
ncbi:proton-coupled amino acid transporter-like protein pathetic [Bombyx mori]